MSKRPFPIYTIGRIIIALYLAQLVFLAGLWLRDRSVLTLAWEKTTPQKTLVRLALQRGSGPRYAFIPVYGIMDRLHWRVWVFVADRPDGWTPIHSPKDIPFEEFSAFVDVPTQLVIKFEEGRRLIINFYENATEVTLETDS
jgi:hypothetical protein